MSIPIVTIYVEYSNINRTLPGTRESEPAPEPSWNPWFLVRNVVRKTDPEPSRNLSFGTCPGTFPEPVVRNLPRNLPGTGGSERGSEPAPEPVVQNLPRNLPGTRDSEPATWKPPRNRPGPYIGKDSIAKAVGEKYIYIYMLNIQT